MSESETIRAASLLSVLTIVLVVLLVLRSGDSAAVPAPEALEICAMTKGALCADATRDATHYAQRDGTPASRRGASVAGTVLDVATATSATVPAAAPGSITVGATPLPAKHFTEMAAGHDAVALLAVLAEPAEVRTARVVEF